jgi:hypothetical protein
MIIHGAVDSAMGFSSLLVQAKLETFYSPYTLSESIILPDSSFQLLLPPQVLSYSELVYPNQLFTALDFFPEILKIGIVSSLTLVTPSGKCLGQFIYASSIAAVQGEAGEKMLQWWYANHNGGFVHSKPGGRICKHAHLDLTLIKGWNQILLQFNTADEEEYTISGGEQNLRWYFVTKF